MRRRSHIKLVTLAACGALALGAALPTSGFADSGGVPHTSKACPAHGHGHAQGPKRAAPNSHGHKCGFAQATSSPPPPTGDDDGSGDTGDDGGTDVG
jgi:hypothetical protein